MSTSDYVDYAEGRDHPTREEQEGDAWEYWYQRANKAESEVYRLRVTLREALLQLEYLETKYPTGTGAAMVARVTAALSATDRTLTAQPENTNPNPS